jgi:hypothetical protein
MMGPADSKTLHPDDAANDSEVWTALMWGSARDWAFIRRLRNAKCLEKLRDEGIAEIRNGLELDVHGQIHEASRNRRFWDGDAFPPDTMLHLDESQIPRTKGIRTHRKTDLRAFQSPQLIIKRGWQKSAGRFQAATVLSENVRQGVFFTQSYLSVHIPPKYAGYLDAACLSFNSSFAVYFVLLTSSRFASYRPEPLVSEFLRLPIPEPQPNLLRGLERPEDVDRRVREAFNFKDAEWVLVEDLFNVTLPDFKGDADSPGRQRTQRQINSTEEPQLYRYCEYFIRVLRAGFGEDKQITATIFHETGQDRLPYRLVAFELNQSSPERVRIEPLQGWQILAELETLNRTWLGIGKTGGGSIYHQRVVRIYDYRDKTRTIFIIKPDAYR